MLHINNNSVVKPLILGATTKEIIRLQNYLYNNSVSVRFVASSAVFRTDCVKSITIPERCLKSFNLLSWWLVDEINKQVNNIK